MSSSPHQPGDGQSATAIAIRMPAVAPFAKSVVVYAPIVLFAVGYFLTARVGLQFRFEESLIVVLWPAYAAQLCALLLTPRSRWWLVLGATAIAHFAAVSSAVPMWRMLWWMAGSSVCCVGTVEILRRSLGLPLHFGSRRQVFLYGAVSLGMLVLFSLTSPPFIRSLLHLEELPFRSLVRVMLSLFAPMLFVAPAVLLWVQDGIGRLRGLRRNQLYEAAALMILLVGAGLLAVSAPPVVYRTRGLMLWVFAPLLWAAARFGPLGASTALFTVAALSVWGASRQLGPFVMVANADQVFSLQLFWIALSLPVMLLAAVIREREMSESALQDQRNQLAHVTRVTTASQLSAALAHELRQPLASILVNAEAGGQLLTRPATNLDEVRVILNDIVDQSKQASGMISRMRSFLKENDSHFETVALDAVVRDALALGHSAIALSRVHVQTRIAGELPAVRGDPVQLLQVVLNLIVNACESMNQVPAPDRHLQLQVGPAGHDDVEVLVVDCGIGLPAGAENRVFDPFFTTKEKGLGLGLAVSRSIATAHGGRLWAENNARGGATFHLVLPLVKS